MEEKTLELEIPLLLPGVPLDDSACLDRLEASLAGQRQLRRAHLRRDASPPTLCLHYDPGSTSLEDVQRLAERAGARIMNRFHHELIRVEGMDCSDCAKVIEHGVGRMDGVLAVDVSYVSQRMRLEYDARKVSRPAIEKRLRSLGYAVEPEGLRSWYQENRELLFSLAGGLAVALGWLGAWLAGLPEPVSLGLYLGAYLLAGWDVARHAWHALRERHFDTDLLMVMAAIGAAVLGQFAEGAFLLFLFSLGHALEERVLDRARSAVRSLADLAPKSALVRRQGAELEIPVEVLEIGDVVIVRPGVRIPVDGEVGTGRSAVDQAPVTGESIPVEKGPGDTVFAGTVNGQGVLEVRVTRLAKDSTLARVMGMVEEAQSQKSPTQQTIQRFERIFVPAALIVTALVAVVPALVGWLDFRASFLRAMSLLVAASPCALALGTPAAVLAGIAQAARNGLLIKGGAHLENLGRLKAMAFDKTGTVTFGRPELTDVVVFDPRISTSELLSAAAAVESRSAHPLAEAVVRGARAAGAGIGEPAEVESITGRGVRATVGDKVVLVGSSRLMEESGIEVDPAATARVQALQAQGRTTLLVSIGARLAGALAVGDTIRPGALQVMTELRRLGVEKTVLLTGDNARVAQAVARQAGLTDVRADLMPEDKLAIIRELGAAHGVTAMVGDGVNDAPALANATVGIAMGGAGTDVALETADVALMGDDLSRLPFAVRLGRATRSVIRQNLVVSLGVIAFLITASLTGWAGIGVAIIFHEGSTIIVVLNAIRLLAVGNRGPAGPR